MFTYSNNEEKTANPGLVIVGCVTAPIVCGQMDYDVSLSLASEPDAVYSARDKALELAVLMPSFLLVTYSVRIQGGFR